MMKRKRGDSPHLEEGDSKRKEKQKPKSAPFVLTSDKETDPSDAKQMKNDRNPSGLIEYRDDQHCEACCKAGEEVCEFIRAQLGPIRQYYMDVDMGNEVKQRPSQHTCLRCTSKHLGRCLSPAS